MPSHQTNWQVVMIWGCNIWYNKLCITLGQERKTEKDLHYLDYMQIATDI